MTRNLWMTLVAFAAFAITFGMYVKSEKQIDQVNLLRYQSRLLAEEMRQSSNDLTRQIGSYVITGNPIFKQHFFEIIDIREGRKARPEHYQNIYWDLVKDDDVRPQPLSHQKIAYLTLVQRTGFTEDELAKFQLAKTRSDALIKIELAAMALSESSTDSDHHRLQASQMLQNAEYLQAKAEIMQPINELFEMMDTRTAKAVQQAADKAMLLRYLFIALGLFIIILLYRLHRTLNQILGVPIEELHYQISQIGKGNFWGNLQVKQGLENSIFGWLSETQIKLASIETNRKIAEEKSQRMTKLYAALSQCNQAIVRCSSEAELFPQICHAAVVWGGMKLAWIGLVDQSKINIVAAFGDSLDYLDDLNIRIHTEQPFEPGPTATALQYDQPYWSQDFLNDPHAIPWHERANRHNIKACASLPLHRNNKPIGAFNIYSDQVNAFDEDVRKLLIEMATDIDFALDTFAKEAERLHAQQMKEFRIFMLEQLTGGVPLPEILYQASIKLESIVPDGICSILLIDQQEQCLRIGAAPHLPDFYNEAVNGLKIGIGVGSCGNTAATGERTIVQEIASHPYWKNFLAIAKQADLASCWSEPILTNGNQVIGTFAIYHHTPSTPDQHQLELLQMAAHFIAIAIERKNAEERIQFLAHFDVLTSLPNRETLEDRAQYLIRLAKRNNDVLAVMFLDLDHFKDINDSLGHSIGDALLMQVATRLRSLLREEDTLSRLGGDEFILLLPESDASGAAQVAQKIISELARPYEIEQYELNITASVGIAIYPHDGVNFEVLSKSADTAMYCAKQEGRNAFRFFTAAMEASSARNLQLVNALHHALSRQQFSLYYQPQISLTNDQVIGVEALIRWQHPELGFVSPAEFIQLAEETGLILSIGEWVIREAAKQAKAWADQGLPKLLMAVNLSAVQFRQIDLPNLVSNILEETGLPPQNLELELTEGVAMHNPQAAIEIMNNLHHLGIRMSIDDFGTGYSSLNYLKKFKVYKLKIDQSFVRDIHSDPEDRALVAAIISMASSLGMKTIAEGVETVEQKQYLIEKGCDEVQGYLYSKPLPADEFETWIKARHNL